MKEQFKKYYHRYTEQYTIQIRGSAEEAVVIVPDVFGKDKSLFPEVKP